MYYYKFLSLKDVANKLERGEDLNIETVEDIVDELISLGNTDKVHAFYDDHYNLKNELNTALLNKKIDEADKNYYKYEEDEEDIDKILEIANQIMYYYTRPMTNQIREQIIEEEYIRLGLNPEDYDI
jgi:hypothetical protein